jgi:1,4-dihydroxy-2-naphthoate octaprenyltransferase
MKNGLYWFWAARPKTLTAAVVPVVVGGAMGISSGLFSFLPWVLCLVFAILIQVGTNYANDYYDFIQGADDHRRIGPDRAVASGWITPGAMRVGMWVVFTAAFVAGCALVPFGGPALLVVGIASIICGVAYTGGPYPLGYNGWGDVFVFIFFGWIATGFTLFVQSGSFDLILPNASGSAWTWLAGMVPGALATNLLVVNNVRDEPLDREAGKRTLVVRLGRRFGLWEYSVLNVLAVAVPVVFAIAGGAWGCLLVLLAVPLMFAAARLLVKARDRAAYQTVLGMTAALLVITGLLFSAGLVLS